MLKSSQRDRCAVRDDVDPESERARAVTATAVDLMEADFGTHDSLSVAFANAWLPKSHLSIEH
ncbi:hypothetical protein BN77_0889 [Rhizobium mesoamericanum STM3625]|uniref:Uncharacterized protein n=1 Tax=Rhizobium mesoamericanum STM3625 TaxID=1211777 RepID=K0PVT9_9HYPH|nr:hypothetical protein BN77_0889 [Rhizobium mesoamericanum STM3625]